MKGRRIYVLLTLLIVLGAGLFLVSREHKSGSDHNKQAAVSVKKGDQEGTSAQVIIQHEQEPVQYLTPLYEVKVQNDIQYAVKKNETASEEPLKFDLYQPADDDDSLRPVFVFIHGGGYTGGGKYDGAEWSGAMAKRGYTVLSVDYRLKKNPFVDFNRTLGDACEDIADVFSWIDQNAVKYNLNTEAIVLGGDSAGGHLALQFVNQYMPEHADIRPSVKAIVDIYGGQLDTSPDNNLPPVLIIHGTADKLVPYAQSESLAAQLKAKGIYHDLLTLQGIGHDYKNNKVFDAIIETTSHFLWNIMNNDALGKLPSYSDIDVASGDVFELRLPEDYSKNGEKPLKVSFPEGWELRGSDNGILQIQVPEGVKRGNSSVLVAQGNEGEEADRFTVNVRVIDPLDISYETFYDENRKTIRTHVDVTNRSFNRLSGLIELDYETEKGLKGTYTTSVDKLEPGEGVRMDLPELARGQRTHKVLNEKGVLLQAGLDTFNALVLPKLNRPVKVNGSVADWSDQAQFEIKDVKISGWKDEQDISANGAVAWDDKNLYLAAEVVDDHHTQPYSGDGIWNGDSIQFGIGISSPDGKDPVEYHELGVARGDGGELYKWRWLAPRGFQTGDDFSLNYTVKRQDNKTNYELAIPWSELIQDPVRVKKGLKLKFSMLVNDDDGQGRRGWLEYNSGIGSAKDIHAFGDLFLGE